MGTAGGRCEEERRAVGKRGGETGALRSGTRSMASVAWLHYVKVETRLALAAACNVRLISACKSKKPEATGRYTKQIKTEGRLLQSLPRLRGDKAGLTVTKQGPVRRE